jgi:hypothetical protein
VQWLVVSLVLSVVLTVVLNVARRAFPGAGDAIGRRLSDLGAPPPDAPSRDRRVHVVVPWKAMLLGSLILTVVLNVLLHLR